MTPRTPALQRLTALLVWWCTAIGAADAARLASHDPAVVRRALVVGTNETGGLDPLAYAEQDAERFAAWLSADEGGGFDEVHLLQGKEGRRDAVLQRLTLLLEATDRTDHLVVYFAGHGSLDLAAGTTDLYLLPPDGQISRLADTAIAVDHLERALSRSGAARTALILDACHTPESRSARGGVADAVRQTLRLRRGSLPVPRSVAPTRADIRLYASAFHEPAFEDPALRAGVYTHYLMAALTAANGPIELLAAHRLASTRVVAHTGGQQRPRWAVSEVGPAPFILGGTDRAIDPAWAPASATWLEARGVRTAGQAAAGYAQIGGVWTGMGLGGPGGVLARIGWIDRSRGVYRTAVQLTSTHGVAPARDGRFTHRAAAEVLSLLGHRVAAGPLAGAGAEFGYDGTNTTGSPWVHVAAAVVGHHRRLSWQVSAGGSTRWARPPQDLASARPVWAPEIRAALGGAFR